MLLKKDKKLDWEIDIGKWEIDIGKWGDHKTIQGKRITGIRTAGELEGQSIDAQVKVRDRQAQAGEEGAEIPGEWTEAELKRGQKIEGPVKKGK